MLFDLVNSIRKAEKGLAEHPMVLKERSLNIGRHLVYSLEIPFKRN